MDSVSHWLKPSPTVRETWTEENVNFIGKPASSICKDTEAGAHMPLKVTWVKHACHPPHRVTSRLKDGQVDERTTWDSSLQWRASRKANGAQDPVWEVRRMSKEESGTRVQILALPLDAPLRLSRPLVFWVGDSLAVECECHVAPLVAWWVQCL